MAIVSRARMTRSRLYRSDSSELLSIGVKASAPWKTMLSTYCSLDIHSRGVITVDLCHSRQMKDTHKLMVSWVFLQCHKLHPTTPVSYVIWTCSLFVGQNNKEITEKFNRKIRNRYSFCYLFITKSYRTVCKNL